MKNFLTKIVAINPKTGKLSNWAGPEVEAGNKDEARRQLDETGRGYCQVVGEKKGEEDANLETIWREAVQSDLN